MPTSVGVSKSGATANVRSPVVPLIENFPESAPPLIEYVSVSPGRSASVAVTVVTAVEFSATLRAALAPPPSEVIVGVLSLTAVTVTAIDCVSVNVPSETSTITSYTLSVPTSVGTSKSGATANVRSPVVPLIENLPESAPPEIE